MPGRLTDNFERKCLSSCRGGAFVAQSISPVFLGPKIQIPRSMPATKLLRRQSRWSSLRQEPPEQLYLFSLIAVRARPGFLFIGFDNDLFCHDSWGFLQDILCISVLWFHHVDGGQSFISYWQCAKQPQSPQSTIPGKAALHSIWLELECKSLSIYSHFLVYLGTSWTGATVSGWVGPQKPELLF